MADTAALRRQLEARIATLHAELQEAEADLKAVDRVDQIEAALARTGHDQTAPAAITIIRTRTRGGRPSVMAACEQALKTSRGQVTEWTPSKMLVEVHKLRPDAKPDNVAISLSRLADRGVLSRVRKDPKMGNWVYGVV